MKVRLNQVRKKTENDRGLNRDFFFLFFFNPRKNIRNDPNKKTVFVVKRTRPYRRSIDKVKLILPSIVNIREKQSTNLTDYRIEKKRKFLDR